MIKRLLFVLVVFLSLIVTSFGYTLNNSVTSWSCDVEDISGNIILDLTENNIDLTTNAQTGVIGRINEALYFNGVDDYASTSGYEPSLNPDYVTIITWVNLNQTGVTQHIVGMYGASSSEQSYRLTISSANRPQMFARTGLTAQSFAESSEVITSDKWYCLAGTFDGSNVKVYVNGSLRSSIGRSGTLLNVNENFTLGQRSDLVNGNVFKGKIDEVYIYDYALNQTQIQAWCEQTTNTYKFVTPSLDITLNNPPQNTNYTFDVENTLLSITTNLNASCNYTYLGVTTDLGTADNLTHGGVLNFGEAFNGTKQIDVTFNCENIENSSLKDEYNLTFYQQGVPLALELYVPLDEQEFDLETNEIEFHIETNYLADCTYLVYNMSSPELFSQTSSWIHKTNYTAFYPNISVYETTFTCEGILLNESVQRNLTFLLVEEQEETQVIQGFDEINSLTQETFGVVETFTSSTREFVLEDFILFAILLSFIGLILGIISISGIGMKKILEDSLNKGLKK